MVRLLRIHVFWDTLTCKYHVGVLLHLHVSPILQTVGKNIFQQNNAQPHTYNTTRDCLQASHVNTIDWLSISHDPSPEEHLWDILGQRVCDLYPFPAATLPELERWLLTMSRHTTGRYMYASSKRVKCSHNALIKVAVIIQDIDLQ